MEMELPLHLAQPPANLEERVRERRQVFWGRVVGLHVDQVELPNGRQALREVVDHPGAVAVLPVTDQGRAVLVWQYRHAAGRPLLEVPAGKLDPQESPEACAQRELEEETGYRAGNLVRLGSFYPSPGFSGEVLHLFLATHLRPGTARPDEDELLRVVEATPQEVEALLRSGALADLKSYAALLAWKETWAAKGALGPREVGE
jgi:ADP-ribose pyrophosphatase